MLTSDGSEAGSASSPSAPGSTSATSDASSTADATGQMVTSAGANSSGSSGSAGGSSTDDATESSTGEDRIFEDYDTLLSSYFEPAAGSSPSGPQLIRDVAFDAEGNVVVVGGTSSPDFPTTAGSFDTTFGGPGNGSTGALGEMDTFVSKFSPDGTLLWSTFLGGPSYERAYAVEVAPNGEIVVAGRAGQAFPTTPGVVQEAFAGDDEVNNPYGPQDGFVARLSADGSELIFSSYFGGVGRGFVRDMDVNATGIMLALSDVGGPIAATAPLQPGPRPTPLGGRDGYYAKLSPDGETQLFGTYLGGSNGGATDGTNPSIRVTDDDEVYVLSFTESTNVDCITAGAYQTTNAGSGDLLLSKFDARNNLVFCTYYGGSQFEGMETHDLAIDGAGNAYVAGGSSSSDLPVTPGAAQPMRLHDADGFVAKISADGSSLLAATYVGNPALIGDINSMNIEGLALAPNGDVVASGSDRPGNNSLRHGLIVRLTPDLDEVLFLSAYAGNGRDELRSVAVDSNGLVLLGGHSTSSDYPTVNPYDGTYDSGPQLAAVFQLLQPIYASD